MGVLLQQPKYFYSSGILKVKELKGQNVYGRKLVKSSLHCLSNSACRV